MFNKKRPYGTIHGQGVAGAVYMQDGHAYDVDYVYCWSNPGMSAPRGVEKVKTLEQAEREHQERQAAIARGEAVPERKAAAAPTPPVPPERTGELTQQQELMQLNVPKLQDLQYKALKAINDEQPEEKRVTEKKLREQIIKGPGAKDRLVAWLIENTEPESTDA
jgi:hypothetical protein